MTGDGWYSTSAGIRSEVHSRSFTFLELVNTRLASFNASRSAFHTMSLTAGPSS